MRKLTLSVLLIIILFQSATAQQFVDKVKFFEDTAVITATLTLNFKKLMAHVSKEGMIFPATFACNMNKDLAVTNKISVEARGHFRREECRIPPMKLIYKIDSNCIFLPVKIA